MIVRIDNADRISCSSLGLVILSYGNSKPTQYQIFNPSEYTMKNIIVPFLKNNEKVLELY